MDIEKAAVVTHKLKEAPQGTPKVLPNQVVAVKIWNQSSKNEHPIEQQIITGADQIDSQIQKIILTMAPGDSWQIKVENQIQQQQQIIGIQILKVGNQVKVNSKSLSELTEQLKQAGNSKIKQKKYSEAIENYCQAYNQIRYNCDPVMCELNLSIISNLALATLNSAKYGECLEWCELHNRSSMEISKKVIYRQASAYKGLKNWRGARETIERALILWKDDPETINDFTALRQGIEKDEKSELAKQKKMYANMFG